MMQDTLDWANKIIAALVNPESLLPFTWREIPSDYAMRCPSPKPYGKWFAYHSAAYCCHDIGEWANPRVFDSPTQAIEWIINHGPAYAEKDNAARFGGGQ